MQVLSIQDLSCMGKCSLTVALPILSAMGISTSVLPTAVLSTHTGFPNPVVQPMTENITAFAEHMASVGGSFDAISTGYLSDPQQAEAVCAVLDRFDCMKVIDPVMGDHGKLYSRITPEHVEAMKQLCGRGDYLLPASSSAHAYAGCDPGCACGYAGSWGCIPAARRLPGIPGTAPKRRPWG